MLLLFRLHVDVCMPVVLSEVVEVACVVRSQPVYTRPSGFDPVLHAFILE